MLFITPRFLSLLSVVALLPSSGLAAPIRRFQVIARQGGDPQTALALDPSQVMAGAKQDGQGADVADNQVRSATSDNNFINFCLTQDVPLTNGQQIKGGSCNPTPMGRIVGVTKMPGAKFLFPPNGGQVKPDSPFTIQMRISNLDTGNFVNPNSNYYAAPQQVNGDGTVIGHSHVVIQKLVSLTDPEPLDPGVFAFFKGLNNQAKDGILTADVPGLPAGIYRIASINASANHNPVLCPVAQHGSIDDGSFFEVTDDNNSDIFGIKKNNQDGGKDNNGKDDANKDNADKNAGDANKGDSKDPNADKNEGDSKDANDNKDGSKDANQNGGNKDDSNANKDDAAKNGADKNAANQSGEANKGDNKDPNADKNKDDSKDANANKDGSKDANQNGDNKDDSKDANANNNGGKDNSNNADASNKDGAGDKDNSKDAPAKDASAKDAPAKDDAKNAGKDSDKNGNDKKADQGRGQSNGKGDKSRN